MTDRLRKSNPWRATALILGLLCIFLAGFILFNLSGKPDTPVSTSAIHAAAQMAGLAFTQPEAELMIPDLEERLDAFKSLRSVDLPNNLPPALGFHPALCSDSPQSGPPIGKWHCPPPPPLPADPADIAFQPIPVLSSWIRNRRIGSEELTRIYLERLKRLGPKLECVVILTEDLAMRQARRADKEIASGLWRGPLHGIPYGIKDLFAVPAYPTTWGASPFREQVLDEPATVVDRLEKAGAVLVAKLTTGALAWGDVWFGGKTRNPWDPDQGSSGSSAGPAAATAAGLVGFAIGTETWGSIVSPSTRCGVTGLRPTFGRISRHGAMALSWSMDKVGPIARSVEGSGLVFSAIHGRDGKDPDCRDKPFVWPGSKSIGALRIGYVADAFPAGDTRSSDRKTLDVLQSMGIELIPIRLPKLPIKPLAMILNAEAAAAFDAFSRSDRDDELVRQVRHAWPNVFRHARMIPAVEYIQGNRVRTLLMREMADLFQKVDIYVCPTFGKDNLLLTNLTGHPALVLPNGFDDDGHPVSITFTGNLYAEANLLNLGRAVQEATDFHRRRPPGFSDQPEDKES